jgi:hypothetical protein
MDRLAEAEGGDDVHAHASKGKVQVGRAGSLALALECSAECARLVGDQLLGGLNGGLGEGAVEDIFAVLCLVVGEKAEAGAVLVEALVKTGLLVPAVLVVVDVVVGVGVGKVELRGVVSALSTALGQRIGHYLIGAYADDIAWCEACQRKVGCWIVGSGHLTIPRMQGDQFVAKGPILDTLDVGLPVDGEACQRRAGKLGEWVEVEIVDERVDGVGGEGSKGRGYE